MREPAIVTKVIPPIESATNCAEVNAIKIWKAHCSPTIQNTAYLRPKISAMMIPPPTAAKQTQMVPTIQPIPIHSLNMTVIPPTFEWQRFKSIGRAACRLAARHRRIVRNRDRGGQCLHRHTPLDAQPAV